MAHFYQQYKHLLFNEKWSDFVAVCGGERIPLHMAVVGAQSKFFEKVSENGFAESQAREVHFPEDDPQSLKTFLTYLYTGNYENEPYTSIMATAAAAYATNGWIDRTGTSPSIETAITEPAVLERALKNLHIETFEYLKREPVPVGSMIVHHALVSAARDDQEEYLGIVRKLIQNLFTAVEMYSLADKYMVDRLQLLARNRFCRTGLNLVTEAARRTGRRMQNPDDQADDSIIDEIWEAVAEAIDAMYRSTPPDAPVRSIPCLLLGKTHVYQVMRGEGIDDMDDEEPPFHEKIAALLLKHPHLKDEIDVMRANWEPIGWRRITSMY